MPQPVIATPRVLALEGGHNFREVGGYPATSGGRLRRGLIWRSAGLDRLSGADCEAIRALGLHTIADLRTEGERGRFPTATGVAETARILAWSREGAKPSSPTEGRAPWRDLDTAAIRGEIARLYTHIAETHAAQFAAIYRAMAEGALPILIHCAAGKDRTGLAVAILLELIGVEREWVVWDYAQTGVHLKPHMISLESAAGVGAMAEWLASLGPEGRKLLMAADEAYLLAALADIEARFGSIRAFARERLALADATIDALEDRLLEP
jgi:protein-tyrosine phosphatase